MPLSPEIDFVLREKLAFPEAFREKDFSCLRRISPSFGFPGMRPENYTVKADLEIRFPLLYLLFLDQALDRLVSASSRIAALSPPTYSLIVFEGSYFFRMGIFFLRWASRLDAFSVYPIRISLPSYAVGTTTVAPGMRPLRSSRTRSSSSHDSFAHDG